jgi:hypothetical protein
MNAEKVPITAGKLIKTQQMWLVAGLFFSLMLRMTNTFW